MKKNYFVLLVACLFLAKGIAQQVVQQQRSLVTKRTADWCPYCGTYGWAYFKGAIEQNGDKAVYMAAHYDGNLATAAGEEITDNFGGFYQPKFFVNEVEQGVSSGNVTAKLESLKTQVDAAFAEAPVANSGFEPVYEDGEIKVAAKVEFFQAAQGDFYLGMYLLEDSVTANQASIGANALHRHLFRASFTPETFGQQIASGNVAAGQEFNLNYSLATSDPAEHKYEVVGIIWEKVGEKYIPVNTWSTKEIAVETVLETHDIASQYLMSVYPSISSQQITIEVESTENQQVAQLEVFDLTGKRVAVMLDGPLNAGTSKFQLDRAMVGGNGLYLIQLKTPDSVKTEKVVFQ